MTLEEMLLLTGQREPSFRVMVDYLTTCNNPLIIETGTARQENNFAGDGQSTLIFDRYVTDHGGEFHSVDIDPDNVAVAQRQVRSRVHCSDSVNFLWQLNQELTAKNLYIDLLYLDSYDVDFTNPGPSSAHHLKELAAIINRLRPGCLIAVDDNVVIDGKHTGKGMYVEEFMQAIGKPMIYRGYQYIWRF